ncbi:MAG: PAS domain S-box protein [Zavarzinella sp.]
MEQINLDPVELIMQVANSTSNEQVSAMAQLIGLEVSILNEDGSYSVPGHQIMKLIAHPNTPKVYNRPYCDKDLFDDWYVEFSKIQQEKCLMQLGTPVKQSRSTVRRVWRHRANANERLAEWISEVRIALPDGIGGAPRKLLRIDISLNTSFEAITPLTTNERRLMRTLLGGHEFKLSNEYEFHYEHDIDGNFTKIDQRASDLFGIPQELCAAYSIYDIYATKSARRHARATIAKYLVGKAPKNPTYIIPVRLPYGRCILLDVRTQYCPNNQVFQGRARDANRELNTSLMRYARIVESGQVAGWDRILGERNPNKHITVSNRWREIFGLSSDEPVTTETFLACVVEEDRMRVASAILQNEEGKAYDIEFRILIDGREKWIHANGKRSSYESLYYVSGQIEDITDRKQALLLLHSISDTSPQMIFIKDEEGKFVYANRALAAFYGFSSGNELEHKSDRDVYHGDDREAIARQLRIFESADQEAIDAARSHKNFVTSCKEEIIPPPSNINRQTKWYSTVKSSFEYAGRPHVLGVSTDVTDLVLRNDALYQMFMHAPIIMYIKDAHGNYIVANHEFAKAMSTSSHTCRVCDVIGKSADFFFSTNTREAIRLRNYDNTALVYGEWSGTEDVRLPNGQLRRFTGHKFRCDLVVDGLARPHIVGAYLDVTDNYDATRYRNISPFVKSIDHDALSHFLGYIKSQLQLIGKETAVAMVDSVARTLGLMSAIDSSRAYRDRMPLGSQNLLLSSCVAIANDMCNQIGLEYPSVVYLSDPIIVKAHANAITTVLYHLIYNAKKYTIDPRDTDDKKIVVSVAQLEGWTTLTVSDAGRGVNGIDLNILGCPGTRFPVTSDSIPGNGNGWYIVKETVINVLQGKISPYPLLGNSRGGADAIVTLPTSLFTHS